MKKIIMVIILICIMAHANADEQNVYRYIETDNWKKGYLDLVVTNEGDVDVQLWYNFRTKNQFKSEMRLTPGSCEAHYDILVAEWRNNMEGKLTCIMNGSFESSMEFQYDHALNTNGWITFRDVDQRSIPFKDAKDPHAKVGEAYLSDGVYYCKIRHLGHIDILPHG